MIRANPLWRAVGLGMMLLWAGCSPGSPDFPTEAGGWGSYEERLQATETEFAYYTLLDQNLVESDWETSGVSLRVPKPFALVPAPNQSPAQEHALSREVLGVSLPGVLGTWKAVLPGKNANPPQTAYLFLMSNHHLWPRSRTSAMAFHQVLVEDVLAELSGLSQLPIECDWRPDHATGYGMPYTFASFQANLAQTNQPADLTVFLLQHGVNERRDEIKAALLFVIPRDATFTGSLPDVDPKALSAQTLRITPRRMDGS